MNKRNRILVGMAAMLLLLLPITRAMGASPAPNVNEPKKISLGTKVLMIGVGETIGLTYYYAMGNENVPAITWTSSDELVAVVNNEGNITAISEGRCTITASCGEGIQEECLVFVGNTAGASDGHEYVDLGLPSGTLWATTNIGAVNPEELGLYFQWGETSGHESATDDNGEAVDVEPNDNGELSTSDDAAHALWGAYWRIPSHDQIEELVNSGYTTITWTMMNGVDGYLIISLVNGKCIFMPATNGQGDYWSRTHSENSRQSYELNLSSTAQASCIPTDCSSLLTVRPVYEDIRSAATITISSDDLNFGTVAVGSSRSLSFDIRNNSYSSLEIQPFALEDTDFAIDWNGGTLPPNTTQTVTVTYTPSSVVLATGGTLSVGSSEESTPVNVFAMSHKARFDLTTRENLVVWSKDGSQTKFLLNHKPIVIISGGKVKVESPVSSAEFSFSDILKMTYEGLIEPANSLNDIDMKKTFGKTADAMTFFSDREDLHVQIVTISGVVLHQSTVKQGSTFSLPLNQFSMGVYIVKVNKNTYKIAIR